MLLRKLVPITFMATAGFTSATAAFGQEKASPAPSAELENVKSMLDKYQDPMLAVRDGYLSTEVCVAFTDGGMGVHFINMATVGPTIKPEQPQVLIYERTGGRLKLAAAEWFVPLAASAEQPRIFEQPLDGPMAGHEPLMPAELRHWDLHVWLWKHNPAGVFNSVNPDLKCDDSGLSHVEKVASKAHVHD
jgi:hypothetical protein